MENNYKEDQWEKFGDTNIIQHGGCFIKRSFNDEDCEKYPSLKNQYDVLYINRTGENDLIASLCDIDINIDEFSKDDDWELIKNYLGWTDLSNDDIKKMRKKEVAYDIVSVNVNRYISRSYKTCYPESINDFMLSEEELLSWINDLEIPNTLLKITY